MSAQQKSNISNLEWGIVFGAAGVIDLGQMVLDFLVVGFFINWLVDAFVGLSLLFYFYIRRVNIDWQIVTSLLVALIGSEATGGIAPLWIADVVFVYFKEKTGFSLSNPTSAIQGVTKQASATMPVGGPSNITDISDVYAADTDSQSNFKQDNQEPNKSEEGVDESEDALAA